MKKLTGYALFLVLLLCAVSVCGCAESQGTNDLQAGFDDKGIIAPVSYEDTPVRYADVNGIKIAYREFGEENTEPLLMLIGFGGTMESWNTTFIGILSGNYHVYVYDHRGMGESTDTDEQYAIPQLSDDAAGLVTALGYDSMNIYGMSMGSSVSQQLLIDNPEKVRKAVLSCATYSSNIPETKKLHSQLEDAAEDSQTDEGVRKEAVANLEWEGSYDGLSGIKNDVILITGTDDDLTPQQVAVEIADQIDGSWLVRFKGVPHAGSNYAPLEYAEITGVFLEMDESPA